MVRIVCRYCWSFICRLGWVNNADCNRSCRQKKFVCIIPVSSNSSSSVLVQIKVNQWSGNKVRVLINDPGEQFDRRSNYADKVFAWMGHGILVGGGRNLEFLLEFRYFKDYRFWIVWYIISEVQNGLNDVADGIFERLSWLNWCVDRHRGGMRSAAET